MWYNTNVIINIATIDLCDCGGAGIGAFLYHTEWSDELNFYGFQKVTLLDYPKKVACTVFTGGCNLRCPFCHNGTLAVNPTCYQTIPEDEILLHLRKKRKLLDGVCITGGEPLIYDIQPFLHKLKELGFSVKLDHNGTRPERLQQIIKQGLVDYVAVDIKNAPAKYGQTVGIPDFDITPIYETIDLLKHSNVEHEFRTTIVNGLHDINDFTEVGQMLSGVNQYFLQQYKDSGDILQDSNFTSYTPSEMQRFVDVIKPYVPNVQIRGI